MTSLKNKLALLALYALISAVACQVSQGHPHQNQGHIGPEVEELTQDDPPNWVPCDMTTTPVISCADCKTRLICKPVGGLLKQCKNPFKAHCNNGVCSSTPAVGC